MNNFDTTGKKNFEPNIENLNIENNPSKSKQRKTTVETFVGLVACKIQC